MSIRKNKNNNSSSSSVRGNILASPVSRQRGTRSLGDLDDYDSDDDSITLEPLTRMMSSKKQPLTCQRKSLRQLKSQHQSLRQLMSINGRTSESMPTLDECFIKGSDDDANAPSLCETEHDSAEGSSTFSLGYGGNNNAGRGSSKEFIVSNPYIEEGEEQGNEEQQQTATTAQDEEEDAFRSSTTSNESTETSTTTSNTVEVTPGVHLPLVCAQETWEAILDGQITVATCQCCNDPQQLLYCIETADLVVCPTCWVISPVDHEGSATSAVPSSPANDDQRIVGIGIKMEDVQTMMEQRTQQQQQP